mmetsp:Transcript_5261/g.13386  ORF Transcript_5261/g.13386 Transcript_5261/m.13386 type:complete len:273 (+) Transcript_5261:1681-2499(+)
MPRPRRPRVRRHGAVQGGVDAAHLPGGGRRQPLLHHLLRQRLVRGRRAGRAGAAQPAAHSEDLLGLHRGRGGHGAAQDGRRRRAGRAARREHLLRPALHHRAVRPVHLPVACAQDRPMRGRHHARRVVVHGLAGHLRLVQPRPRRPLGVQDAPLQPGGAHRLARQGGVRALHRRARRLQEPARRRRRPRQAGRRAGVRVVRSVDRLRRRVGRRRAGRVGLHRLGVLHVPGVPHHVHARADAPGPRHLRQCAGGLLRVPGDVPQYREPARVPG